MDEGCVSGLERDGGMGGGRGWRMPRGQTGSR